MADNEKNSYIAPGGPVTLADVAKLAGVSPVTVSRAINTPALVKPRTLEVIDRVIAKTGYVPNLLAGGLASRRTRLIAAIVPTVSSTIFAETIEGLNAELVSAGYQLLLGLSGYDNARELELTRAILARRPDGIVLTGITHLKGTRAMLTGAGLPIVEIWDSTPRRSTLRSAFRMRRLALWRPSICWSRATTAMPRSAPTTPAPFSAATVSSVASEGSRMSSYQRWK